jgi:hypothetical protein
MSQYRAKSTRPGTPRHLRGPAMNAQASSSRIHPRLFAPIDLIALQEEANLSRLLAKIIIETPLAQSISTLSTLALIASNILSDLSTGIRPAFMCYRATWTGRLGKLSLPLNISCISPFPPLQVLLPLTWPLPPADTLSAFHHLPVE